MTSPAQGGRPALALPVAATGIALAWFLPLCVTWRDAPDLHHAWAAPLLMIYLWWERWDERPALDPSRMATSAWWTLGVLLAAAELPLRLLLTPFPEWPALVWAYTFLFAVAALLVAYRAGGANMARWLGGPLLLLAAVLPLPTVIETKVILHLREGMAEAAVELSNALGQPAMSAGTSVRLANSWVGIDEACGGIRSLQACLMIALFFGEWYRMPWRRRLALVGLGFAAAIVGNFGRVLFLSSQAGGGADAVRAAHDPAGWCAMVSSLAATGIAGWMLGGRRWPELARKPRTDSMSSPSPLWRWAAVLGMLFLFNEGATRAWYAHGHEQRASVPKWTVRLPEDLPTFRSEPLSDSAREILHPDRYVAGTWQIAPSIRVSSYYIEWTHGQLARSIPFLHNPTVCLPYAGCELVRELEVVTVQSPSGVIPFHAYKFHAIGGDLLVLFTIWDTDRNQPLLRPAPADSWSKWWQAQWSEVRDARQHQPAQLLSVALPWTIGGTDSARTVLREIISL